MPYWLGFVIIIVIGIILLIAGAVQKPVELRYIAWGVFAIVSAVVSWISGATSEPKFTSKDTFGAVVREIKTWAWIVIMVMFVALVIFLFTYHPHRFR
jgi:drug/metabolite transporter (DMT)-like permease